MHQNLAVIFRQLYKFTGLVPAESLHFFALPSSFNANFVFIYFEIETSLKF